MGHLEMGNLSAASGLHDAQGKGTICSVFLMEA